MFRAANPSIGHIGRRRVEVPVRRWCRHPLKLARILLEKTREICSGVSICGKPDLTECGK
jgi:hypothetical protein